MFRRYENPVELEKYLDNAKQELEQLKVRIGSMDENDPDFDSMYFDMLNLADVVEDLKERIRFAWDDDEYDQLNESDSWDNFISCFE